MKTALLLFLSLLWCQTSGSLTDRLVNFGENVTLDCPIGENDIFWIFQKLTNSPVEILRTFSSYSSASFIRQERFKGKYSGLTQGRLFISNITIDELGIYYCAEIQSSVDLLLGNGIRLYVTEAAEDENQTHYQTTQQTLIVLYVILNIVMISAVIALFQVKLQLGRKRRKQDEEQEQIYDTNAEEFSEVEFRLFHPTSNTFVAFQKPKTKSSII